MTGEIAGTWSSVELDGKLLDLYEPRQSAEHGRAVMFLHDHDLRTLKDNAPYSAELGHHGLRCVCPHGQRSWWLDTICTEFDAAITPIQFLRERVVPFLAEKWGTRPPGIGLMGTGMGGQGVLQLAYRRAREFPVVAAISPAVDFQNCQGRGLPLDAMFASREAARQATAILQLNPLNWPRHQLLVCDPLDPEWLESVDRLMMKLSSMGIPFESDLTTSAGGHCWEYFEAMAQPVVAFMSTKLEEESRRL